MIARSRQCRIEDRRQVVRHRIVDQLLVTEIEHQPDAASRRFLREDREIVFGDQRAGRIARRVDDDAAGARRDRAQKRLGGDAQIRRRRLVRTTTGVASASLTCSVSVGQYGACMMTSSPASNSVSAVLKSACLPPADAITSCSVYSTP